MPGVLAGTFIDDFEDGDTEGWVSLGGKPRCEGGVVTLHEQSPVLVLDTDAIAECVVEMHVRMLSLQPWDGEGNGVTIGTRAQGAFLDSMEAVMLGLNGHADGAPGLMAVSWVGSFVDQDLRFVPHVTALGEWYRLRVAVEGDQVSCSIDGQEVMRFHDDLLPPGRILIGVGFGYNVAQFDNVVITGEGVPDYAPPGWSSDHPTPLASPPNALASAWAELKVADR
ncbi:hypothetical protein HOK31_21325 [Candidatus Poribacteria bacterium]|nr:hypothetical protein [Candidatus Poribacteria bacterium]MBT7804310.1 hypothetical protein [Candidatus Poribacteria bacterium]